MANTKSAEKAVRQSNRKKSFNLFWKRKIKALSKSLKVAVETKDINTDILNKEFVSLQKVLDKAAKTKAIHKNKANRLKSRYAKKLTAQTKQPTAKPARTTKSRSSKS